MLRMQPLNWPLAIHDHRSEVRRPRELDAWVDKVFGFFAESLCDVLGDEPKGMLAAIGIEVLDQNNPGREALAGRVTKSQFVQIDGRHGPAAQIKNASDALRRLGQAFEGEQ